MMRWSGTAFYLLGMMLTAVNVYPANLVFGAIGGLLWCVVGHRESDHALFTVEAASFTIYCAGLLAFMAR